MSYQVVVGLTKDNAEEAKLTPINQSRNINSEAKTTSSAPGLTPRVADDPVLSAVGGSAPADDRDDVVDLRVRVVLRVDTASVRLEAASGVNTA